MMIKHASIRMLNKIETAIVVEACNSFCLVMRKPKKDMVCPHVNRNKFNTLDIDIDYTGWKAKVKCNKINK